MYLLVYFLNARNSWSWDGCMWKAGTPLRIPVGSRDPAPAASQWAR